jgi:hypothetical protein
VAEDFDHWVERLPKVLKRQQKTTVAQMKLNAAKQQALARQGAPRRKGNLKSAVTGRLMSSAGSAQVQLSMPSKYAPVEFGGTIRPKRGSWLAIPIGQGPAAISGPRSDPFDLFVFKKSDGRLFLASSAGGALTIRWRLIAQTTHKARPFMGPAQAKGADILTNETLKALEGDMLNGR